MLFALLGSLPGFADTVRVTTWNLQSANSLVAASNVVVEAAAVLKKLEPDVILLQEVRDWRMCAELLRALKPANYNLLVCSAFRPVSAQTSTGQLAILSRHKAYFSWSAPWDATGQETLPGGFAFAAVTVGQQHVGFFNLQAESPGALRACGERVLQELNSVRKWEANRVQTFVIGGTLEPARETAEVVRRLLQEAAFEDGCASLSPEQRNTVAKAPNRPPRVADYLLVDSGGIAIAPQVNSAGERYPVTCEVELDPVKITAARAARLAELERRARLTVEASEKATATAATVAARPQSTSMLGWWLAGGLATGVVLIFLLRLWLRRALQPHSPALLPLNADGGVLGRSSYTVIASHPDVVSLPDSAAAAQPPRAVVQMDPTGATQTQAAAAWQQRALAAEQKAEQAQALTQQGLMRELGRWLKNRLVRKALADRAQLLHVQQAAALKAITVDQRLARLERMIQQQNRAYERRIEDLTIELLAAKEENRELIRAQIAQVKAEMAANRARILAQAAESSGTDVGP